MLTAVKNYPRATFELGFGYETKNHHPYHLDYIDQNKRTWMAYVPVWGQVIYTFQLIWLFKKNVSDHIPKCSPDWTARLVRSLLVVSVIGVLVTVVLDTIGTFTIHLHSKQKNAENLYYTHLV